MRINNKLSGIDNGVNNIELRSPSPSSESLNSEKEEKKGKMSVAEQVKVVAVGSELRVESPAGILSHINVYNTSGVLVSSANDVDMFTTTLTKGIYIVETVDGRSTHTSKVAIY